MSSDQPMVAADEEPAPEGDRTQSADTPYAIERLLVDVWRRMPPWEKACQLVECCRAVEQLATAGLRLRYPHATEHELRLRAVALRSGRELTVEVYRWDPDATDA